MPFEPIKWGRDKKSDFTGYMHNEIAQTKGDRSRLEKKWLDLITQHRARVIGDGTSDVPFIGASDLEYPLTAIHFEPVYADLMQTLHIPKDFWSITPLRSDMVDAAKPFQSFLSLVERNEIKMRLVNQKAFIDLGVLGTAIWKDGIHHQVTEVPRYADDDTIVRRPRVDFRPLVKHVPLQDFFIPAYAWQINPDEVGGAPWVAHRFYLTEGQFAARSKGAAPFMPNFDTEAANKVKKWAIDMRENKVKERQRQEDELMPWQDLKIELYEVWVRFDADGDGIDEDIVVTWHQESGTILRAIYNPYLHGERPFTSTSYIPGFGFYGMGIAEADEWAQIAMTRLLNSTINNVLLANQRMFTAPLGANISPDEALHGGKIWLVGPGEKVEPLQLGEVYPSIFNLMQGMMQWSEQRTGVSELRQGDVANLPSRTPASTVMSVLSEGKKKFDMVLANCREEAMAKIGQHVMQNLVQINKTDKRYEAMAMQVLGAEEGAKVAQILQGPVHDIDEKFGISVTATSSQTNKEVEKQTFATLAQMAAQFYPQLVQYAQLLAQGGDPSIMLSTIQSAYNGQTELLKRLLEVYDIQNPEVYLPPLAGAQAQQMAPMGQPAGAPGVAAGPQFGALGGPQGAAPFAQPNPLSQFLGV